MQTLNSQQFEHLVNRDDWSVVDTKYRGTDAYDTHLGLMRVMFQMDDDPLCLVSVCNDEETQLWATFDDEIWNRYF